MLQATQDDNSKSLVTLLKKQLWWEVEQILDSPRQAKEHWCIEKDDSNLSVLAIAIGYGAPVNIIDNIIKLSPSLVYERDNFGANPLHVGCLNGAPFQSIQYMAFNFQELVSGRDNDDRTPLHHAVEYACTDGEQDDNYIDVIDLLCKKAPETILRGDKGGEMPIDIVQRMKVDLDEQLQPDKYNRMHKRYCIMKSHYVKHFMKRRKQWELNGFLKNMPVMKQSFQLPKN